VTPGQLGELRDARLEGPIILVSAGMSVEISPDEYRTLFPYLSEEDGVREQTRAAEPPDWAVPGVVVWFAEGPALFVEGFRDDPLYLRLLPVLAAAPSSQLAVRVNADGSIGFAGQALGVNGHMCNASGEGLRFDPATGWYSGPDSRVGVDPSQRRLVPVLLLDRDRAEIRNDGHPDQADEDALDQYASCGMRAGFQPMFRVPDSGERAAAFIEEMAQDQGEVLGE
jgi:hypothetical protein